MQRSSTVILPVFFSRDEEAHAFFQARIYTNGGVIQIDERGNDTLTKPKTHTLDIYLVQRISFKSPIKVGTPFTNIQHEYSLRSGLNAAFGELMMK